MSLFLFTGPHFMHFLLIRVIRQAIDFMGVMGPFVLSLFRLKIGVFCGMAVVDFLRGVVKSASGVVFRLGVAFDRG